MTEALLAIANLLVVAAAAAVAAETVTIAVVAVVVVVVPNVAEAQLADGMTVASDLSSLRMVPMMYSATCLASPMATACGKGIASNMTWFMMTVRVSTAQRM